MGEWSGAIIHDKQLGGVVERGAVGWEVTMGRLSAAAQLLAIIRIHVVASPGVSFSREVLTAACHSGLAFRLFSLPFQPSPRYSGLNVVPELGRVSCLQTIAHHL